MLLWLISGVALLLAVTASLQASRAAKRLAKLSQSYWDLRYEHDRLKARVEGDVTEPPREPRQSQPGTTFVPLSSVRR